MSTYIRFSPQAIKISGYTYKALLVGEAYTSLKDAEDAVKEKGGYVVKALDLKLVEDE